MEALQDEDRFENSSNSGLISEIHMFLDSLQTGGEPANNASDDIDETGDPRSAQVSVVDERSANEECLHLVSVVPTVKPTSQLSPCQSPPCESIGSGAKKRPRSDSVRKTDAQRAKKRTRTSQITDCYDSQNESADTASPSRVSPWFINSLHALKSQVWTMLGSSS